MLIKPFRDPLVPLYGNICIPVSSLYSSCTFHHTTQCHASSCLSHLHLFCTNYFTFFMFYYDVDMGADCRIFKLLLSSFSHSSRCISCHGQGYKTCSVCHGSENLLHFIQLTVTWYVRHTDTHSFPLKICPDFFYFFYFFVWVCVGRTT